MTPLGAADADGVAEAVVEGVRDAEADWLAAGEADSAGVLEAVTDVVNEGVLLGVGEGSLGAPLEEMVAVAVADAVEVVALEPSDVELPETGEGVAEPRPPPLPALAAGDTVAEPLGLASLAQSGVAEGLGVAAVVVLPPPVLLLPPVSVPLPPWSTSFPTPVLLKEAVLLTLGVADAVADVEPLGVAIVSIGVEVAEALT